MYALKAGGAAVMNAASRRVRQAQGRRALYLARTAAGATDRGAPGSAGAATSRRMRRPLNLSLSYRGQDAPGVRGRGAHFASMASEATALPLRHGEARVQRLRAVAFGEIFFPIVRCLRWSGIAPSRDW